MYSFCPDSKPVNRWRRKAGCYWAAWLAHEVARQEYGWRVTVANSRGTVEILPHHAVHLVVVAWLTGVGAKSRASSVPVVRNVVPGRCAQAIDLGGCRAAFAAA